MGDEISGGGEIRLRNIIDGRYNSRAAKNTGLPSLFTTRLSLSSLMDAVFPIVNQFI